MSRTAEQWKEKYRRDLNDATIERSRMLDELDGLRRLVGEYGAALERIVELAGNTAESDFVVRSAMKGVAENALGMQVRV